MISPSKPRCSSGPNRPRFRAKALAVLECEVKGCWKADFSFKQDDLRNKGLENFPEL